MLIEEQTSALVGRGPAGYAAGSPADEGFPVVITTSTEALSELLELAPDPMLVCDAEGEIVGLNSALALLFGYGSDQLLGARYEVLVPERLRRLQRANHEAMFEEESPGRRTAAGQDAHGRHRDGNEFPVEVTHSPLEIDGRRYLLSAIRDITARRRAERDAQHFAAVVASSHDAIIGKDLNGVILSWNFGAERLYGHSAAEAVGRNIAMVVPPGHEDELPDLLDRARAGERVEDHETVGLRRDGTHVDVSISVSPILDPDGVIVGASTISRDITAQLRYQKQLRFLAEHDALTGVRNRRRFERDVSEQVDRAHRYGEQAALLMIDVDDFKSINDTHGHRTGDRALKLIAKTLASRVHNSDMLARIGGDEFAALLPYADIHQAQVVAESLSQAVANLEVQANDGSTIRVGVSVGVALIDEMTASDEAVLAEADRTMYRRKARRR